MASTWINRDAAELPTDIQPPDFEIRDLAELRAILRIP
jgi:FMN phosphatase YigB (HAD superfamily)